MTRTFKLPDEIRDLVAARNRLKTHYTSAGLEFTLDGNLVGDLGEALAAELFGLRLSKKCGAGIDGHAQDGRTVQVKATGRRLGPAFRQTEARADHLIFFDLDFDACSGSVIYNGPEHLALAGFPLVWVGQRSVSFARVQIIDAAIADIDRLPIRSLAATLPPLGLKR